MNHLVFSQQTSYPIALLVPVIRKDEIEKAYIQPYGIDSNEVVVLDLHYSQTKKKTPIAEIKAYLQEVLIPDLQEIKAQFVVCTDSEYFKVLTGVAKAEANLGYAMDSAYGDFKVFYAPNYRTIFYDPPKIISKISQGMTALAAYRTGLYIDPGSNIIKFEAYPTDPEEIRQWLVKLLEMDCDLTSDIEAFSLKHFSAGIGTITFCWSKTEGIAFPVDLGPDPEYVRALLKEFFLAFKRKMIWHSISYDVYVLIYQLFMDNLCDTSGLLDGMDVMLRNWDDTKLITYLATNSCAGNRLSLKEQAQEYAGNWAIDEIKDITKIPLNELLRYNLVDGLSTWYVHEKWWDTMVADQQLEVYEELFKPAILDIIQMQLTGMPIDMDRVHVVKAELEIDLSLAEAKMQSSPLVQRFLYQLEERHVQKRNIALKKKQISMGDEPQEFNPNSNPQLQALLYEMLALPVLSRTAAKEPSCDGDTLKSLKNHTKDPLILEFLNALLDYSSVNKILTSFIPAMLNAQQGPDGWHYLFGNFNLGGTLSGRLSSSDPNLQNLPASSRYAKAIKSCFVAPPGWLFVGLDFASLEDRISALTTKDPNKLKVYTDGYDGHSLRAYSYFGDQMPDIIDTVESINSIQDKYKPLRQDSKAPTFALTYQGTWITLVNNCGFSEKMAKMIEERYHVLYKISDDWVEEKLQGAAKNGYITVAFGLRVRTPLLHQVIRKTSKTPYEAEAEGRSAGNALGQSWCLLNSRAGSEFMSKVRNSKHRLSIKPCAQIHDAGYFLIKDDMETLLYTNEHLVKAVQWQSHPDIWHDEVKLGGEVSIFYPNWNKECVVPNGATESEILGVIKQHLVKLSA